MKLYTEEQVKNFLKERTFIREETIDAMCDTLTPIELPSDEEIEDKGKWVFNNAGHTIFTNYNTVPSWVEGAKWVIQQIKQETLEEVAKWQAERSYSEEDMAESFIACWNANVPEGNECKLSFKEWFEQFKK